MEEVSRVKGLEIRTACAPSLWEEDGKLLSLDATESGRSNSHCTYGCGCAVGYLFVSGMD